MRETLPMTTCRCDKHPGDVIVTKKFLEELQGFIEVATKTKTYNMIIQHLEVKKDIYFSQSLIGGATYFTHKVRTIEDIIKELEEMKCR